jgi:hypothetical protein
MHIELLVEEPSAEAALNELLPRIIGKKASWWVHVHQGKGDLLANLVPRLKGYARWLPEDWRIVVLVDRDSQDCLKLKKNLETAAGRAGLCTRSHPGSGSRVQVINRIAVEELEAWFFGDVEALCAAFPGVPPTLGQKARYRDPDAIKGGTSEALERELQRVGYFKGGLGKIEAARTIASHMMPERNRSRSFCNFRDALVDLA